MPVRKRTRPGDAPRARRGIRVVVVRVTAYQPVFQRRRASPARVLAHVPPLLKYVPALAPTQRQRCVNIVPRLRRLATGRRRRCRPSVTLPTATVSLPPQSSDGSMPFSPQSSCQSSTSGCRCRTSSRPSDRYEGPTAPHGPAHAARAPRNCRNGDRDQNGNDQHDHHQLDEGETLLVVPTTRRQGP